MNSTGAKKSARPAQEIFLLYLPLIFFAVNFFLKLLYISKGDIALDEPFILFNSRKSWSEIMAHRYLDNNSPFIYVLMHGWMKIAGTGAFAARFPSAFFSSLASMVMLKTGERFISFRAGVIAAIFFTASSLHMYIAHDAGIYSFFFLMTALSFYIFLGITADSAQSISKWSALVAINTVLCYSHFFGFIIVAVQGACMLLVPSLRKLFVSFAVAGMILLLAYAAYLPVLIRRFTDSSGGTWIQKPVISDLYTMLWRFSNVPVITVLMILILFTGMIFFFLKKSNKNITAAKVLLYSFLICYGGLFIISFRIPVFLDRYIVFTTFFYYLLAATAIDTLAPQTKAGFALSMLLPLSMLATLQPSRNKNRNIRALVAKTRELQGKNSAVFLMPEWFDLNFVYYYNRGWFNNTASMSDSLKSNHIYPLNNAGQYYPSMTAAASDIIFVDTGHEFTDPENSFEKEILKNFPVKKEYKIQDHLYVIKYER